MIGWIKLHRSLINWEWYDDHNATRLLVHLLISVNYEDKKWKGQVIKAGSMVLSWDTLAASVHLSAQQVRTAMAKLESSGEVTRQATNRNQLVTLVKWEDLQSKEALDNRPSNRQTTGKQQTDNRQITTTKEEKENKEPKEVKNIEDRKLKFAHTLEPFLEQYGKDMINKFYSYWTEPNKSNSKFKQELLKTWSLSHRLANWDSNNFNSKPVAKRTGKDVFLETFYNTDE
jgi:hypothetical protein